jgi:hypothetical protein
MNHAIHLNQAHRLSKIWGPPLITIMSDRQRALFVLVVGLPLILVPLLFFNTSIVDLIFAKVLLNYFNLGTLAAERLYLICVYVIAVILSVLTLSLILWCRRKRP